MDETTKTRVKKLMTVFSDLSSPCPNSMLVNVVHGKYCNLCEGHGRVPSDDCVAIAEQSIKHRKQQQRNR